jgi:SAM-dependent methyltransferase
VTAPHPMSWEDAVLQLRMQADKQELVLAAYYDDPALQAADRYWRSSEWSALRPLLPSPQGTRVLDVGAGRGIASFAFAKDGFIVTALEPDPSALVGAQAIRSLAAEANLSILVEERLSEALPFADGSFHVVFARAVLHHTRDLEHACRQFFRVLKPGGLLLAVREHVISRPEDLQAFFDIHPLHHLYGGENAFQLQRYESAIRDAGFTLERVIAPLDSDINLAPLDAAGARDEIAKRVGSRIPGARSLTRGLLSFPGFWPVARRLMRGFDHRPGRLYSFVARRP